jgi:hypothetical protein
LFPLAQKERAAEERKRGLQQKKEEEEEAASAVKLEEKLNDLLRLGTLLEHSSSVGERSVNPGVTAAMAEQLQSLDPATLAEVVAAHATTKEEKEQVGLVVLPPLTSFATSVC